ncbi:MAG TPA: FoF1 ATP synthase subunit gamma [bacterium]
MIPLIRLKHDVQFNGDFAKAIDVMKGIAASRFYQLQRHTGKFEGLGAAAREILGAIDMSVVDHPFVRPASERTGVIMVTSDAGLLGGLNTQVVLGGLHEGGPGASLSVIGERGLNTLRDARGGGFAAFPGIEDATRVGLAHAVRDHAVQQVRDGTCGRLIVVYPRPVSFSVQRVVAETLLPCTAWIGQDKPVFSLEDVLWESHPSEIVEYVVWHWIGQRLEEIFALSRLAELAARAMHLEGSYQELLRLGKKLKQQYFRARHEVIDRSMREIFAAQLLYRKIKERDERPAPGEAP